MKYLLPLFLCFGPLAWAQFSFDELGPLPEALSETSGLLFIEEKLYTFNDSGGEAALYEIDLATLEVKRTIAVANATNVDWEAISHDDSYVYIGDIGNNVGVRNDLVVYRVPLTALNNTDAVTAEAISFSYADQTNFEDNGNSDWDAESLIVLDEELIIFTKQWQSLGTVAYTLPKTPGAYVAQRITGISDLGLITDASYDDSTGKLILLGYSSFLSPFVIGFNAINTSELFNERSVSFDLGVAPLQAEGIVSDGSGGYYISSEFFSRTTPNITSTSRLFTFRFNEMPEPDPEPNPDPNPNPEPNPEPEPDPDPEPPSFPEISENADETLIIYTDKPSNSIQYLINSESTIIGKRIYDVTGKKIWEQAGSNLQRLGEWTGLPRASVYYFTVYFRDGIHAKAFIAQ
jgi:hypothetical protein